METFSALLAPCEGNPTRGLPSQRPVTRSFHVFFDLRLNKRLNKQSRCRWFETPWWSLWRRGNALAKIMMARFTDAYTYATRLRWIDTYNRACTYRDETRNRKPLFTKRMDVLPEDLVKSRCRKVRVYTLSQSLWKLTGTSTAALPRCLLNFRAMR